MKLTCPVCKSTQVIPYSNKDLLIVVAGMPDAGKATGFRCEGKCKISFYLYTKNVEEMENDGHG